MGRSTHGAGFETRSESLSHDTWSVREGLWERGPRFSGNISVPTCPATGAQTVSLDTRALILILTSPVFQLGLRPAARGWQDLFLSEHPSPSWKTPKAGRGQASRERLLALLFMSHCATAICLSDWQPCRVAAVSVHVHLS